MKKLLLPILLLVACNNKSEKEREREREEPVPKQYPLTGSIEKLDPALDSIVSPAAKAEIIADGLQWAEGPLWIEEDSMLLFSDVKANTVYKWTEVRGKEIYLKPSGYTAEDMTSSKESGSNGLVRDGEGRLLLCQQGDRRMARMDTSVETPAPKYFTIADKFNGKRFNSPNDVVCYFDDIYFTDPPYGLATQSDNDPLKETTINGVYRISPDGKVSLIIDSLKRPNGLAFFPGGTKLLVSNSDETKPNWYIYDLDPSQGKLSNGRLFYSAAGLDKSLNGLPDGLKIDTHGNVFATGPGGVFVFDSTGKLLGKIKLDKAASNCALSANEKTLYITNDDQVLRVKLRD